ncbi:hypothetical protein E1262_22945 [Jiangella aurantiaca]|uniref:Uncharacterized protein n=1 Tax=Jiangella aurantiaca TaxID=2530373 RepID=A0A4R5A5H1_9ACTN|nr:hypothetical protein [Jiangella aurantiaca]TDD66216.1 hypothetical protein E1262_22945 [Jiangella aurantiaca]
MTDGFDDDLRRRLTGLSADLDGVSLPGPSAARKRAARRTRHQVTGGVLAGVAAVAAGVLVLSPSDLSTTPEPAPPATLSTLTPDPTATASDLSAALLTPEDIAGDTGVAWAAADEPGPEVACDPARTVEAMSSVLDHARAGFASASGGVRQDLVRFGDGGSAAGLADALAGCLDEEGADGLPAVVDTVRLTGVGDEGWMTRYYMDPNDQEATAAVVAVVRSRDVVSVTVQTESTADTAGEVELDLAVPVAAARRMCDVLYGDSCVTEPGTEDLTGADPTEEPAGGPTDGPTVDPTGAPADDPTEPADDPTTPPEELLQLADDPFLTEEDVAQVGTATGFVRRPDMDPSGVWTPCLQDPAGSGATDVRGLGYNHELDASIVEWVAVMPDGDSVFRFVGAHTSLPDVCGEVGEFREQTVGEPVAVEVDGADDAVAWTVEDTPTPDNPGSESSFAGIGVARVGNIVVVVGFSAMGDPSGGDWPGVATGLLATALERAVA